MPQITFTNVLNVLEDFLPQPASKVIPEWYKDTESYMGGDKKPRGDGTNPGTIKRCMPVFDALNAGYTLVTYTDIWVSRKEQILTNGKLVKEPWYEWPSYAPVEFHPPEQALLYPGATGGPIPKWLNPWGIKTPPGYSTLFIAPVHRYNPLIAFPGVVDTDTYTAPVNVIFELADPDFEGLVPAGTPIVQVIPFKREAWTMSLGTEEDLKSQGNVTTKIHTRFFDSYKNHYRQIKEYK
jgi:hypothetical protein